MRRSTSHTNRAVQLSGFDLGSFGKLFDSSAFKTGAAALVQYKAGEQNIKAAKTAAKGATAMAQSSAAQLQAQREAILAEQQAAEAASARFKERAIWGAGAIAGLIVLYRLFGKKSRG